MEVKNASVLITGGSDGIGKGLAARLLAAGAQVLVTGRNQQKLMQAAAELPGLLTFTNDISLPKERERLVEHVKNTLPGLNILINNAGIQRRISLASDHDDWRERQAEIDTLLSAPIHLNHLLIPLLLANHRNALIINVTSGGAYIPQTFAPVYSACKAALHHYTLILRQALSQTPCRVAELIPPAVQTGLAGAGHTHGAALDAFCDYVFEKLFINDRETVGYGPTADLQIFINGQPQEALFQTSSLRASVQLYRQPTES